MDHTENPALAPLVSRNGNTIQSTQFATVTSHLRLLYSVFMNESLATELRCYTRYICIDVN